MPVLWRQSQVLKGFMFGKSFIRKCHFLFFIDIRLAEPFGSIHDGPGNYSVGVKCSWLIDARDSTTHANTNTITTNQTIRLHIEEFATECGWDHLYVYDGDSVDSPLLAVFR